MRTSTTGFKHVEVRDNCIPYIADTTMKVIELVMAQKAYGWSPEELHFQHPYLEMSQIYSALAYYWEHKDELDDDIKKRQTWVETQQKLTGDSPFVTRLRNQQH